MLPEIPLSIAQSIERADEYRTQLRAAIEEGTAQARRGELIVLAVQDRRAYCRVAGATETVVFRSPDLRQ